VSVAVHGVSLSHVTSEDTALVLGAGMIGLLTLQALRAAGCSRVFIADVDGSRLELAKTLGATTALQASGGELISEILQLTNGEGVDVAVEAVGINATVRAAVGCVRKAGRVTLVGNSSPEVTLPLQLVVSRQIRLQGSCASAGEYPKAIELVSSGTIKVMPLISAVVPLEEGPKWFARLHAGEPNLMKVVLTPGTIS
jgi:L-iditol 2-dehydrogenase